MAHEAISVEDNKVLAGGELGAVRVPKGHRERVLQLLLGMGSFASDVTRAEVDWFYRMGIPGAYFVRFQPAEVAMHIHSLIAAKKLAAVTTGDAEDIRVDLTDDPENSLHLVAADHNRMVPVELRITEKAMALPLTTPYRFEFWTSEHPIVPEGKRRLGVYSFKTCKWTDPTKVNSHSTVLAEVASDEFLQYKPRRFFPRYQMLLDKVNQSVAPVCEYLGPDQHKGIASEPLCCLMLAFRHRARRMMQFSRLLHAHGLRTDRKFTETFANGTRIYTFYFAPPPNVDAAAVVGHLREQFTALHTMGPSSFGDAFLAGSLSADEFVYAAAAARVAYYFLNRRTEEFTSLCNTLRTDPVNMARLRTLHQRELAPVPQIEHTLQAYPALLRAAYADFVAQVQQGAAAASGVAGDVPVLGGRPVNEALQRRVLKEAVSELDRDILGFLLTFNASVLKTNFYVQEKAALAFRLDPAFMRELDWPAVPFGVFFIFGADFQGIHVRFSDIARGGIRAVRSSDAQQYHTNHALQFSENYNLAWTQNLKNKDIPERGSKGTILLDTGAHDTFHAFQKYVSALLDLIGTCSPGVVDHYGAPEWLFLGPDENTADCMEWAALYARERGYRFWRAFTTGKPMRLGGIPHDLFGMTTRGVRRYVEGCMRKLHMDPLRTTKLQTGGPDGDLGSNEILLSREKIMAVVDGSGVVHDPNGLDRDELERLARERKMVGHFAVSKLSPRGFRVLVSDRDVRLPDGTVVESGVTFRNEFHLLERAAADLLVPCGGRPSAVNGRNVARLLDGQGRSRFRVIVEGANLFLTQDARLQLERAGAVLYKDASANKGGVTSSSLEVLAALALDDERFARLMEVPAGNAAAGPQFYRDYVAAIHRIIETNADAEFECLWREHERTGIPRCQLTDQLSQRILTLNGQLQQSPLWMDEGVRLAVLRAAVPKLLQTEVKIEEIVQRVPLSYLQALFGSFLASRFVYEHGLEPNQFAFMEFMAPYMQHSSKKPNSKL